MKTIVHIKDLLNDFVVKTPKIGKALSEAGAAELWAKVAGPKCVEQTEAINVSGGVLYVAVSNSVIAQELSLRKGELILKINERLGKGRVLKDIRFRAGHITGD